MTGVSSGTSGVSDPVPAPQIDVRLVTALAVAGLVVAQFPTFLTAGVAVQIQRDLGFGTSALGAAIAGSLATSALGSIALGRFVQRVGWAWGMRISAVISIVCMAAIALFVSGFAGLLALLAVGGISKSLGHPAANLAIAAEAPRERFGLLFGIKQAGVPATAMLAGLAVPTLALTLGWRSAFWVAAGLSLVFAVVVPGRARGNGVRPGHSDKRAAKGDVHAPSLLLLAAGAGIGVGVANSIAAFITTYGVEVGFSEGSAGIVLAVGSAAGIVMRIFIGWVADRRELGLGAVSGMLVIGAVGVGLLTTGSQLWVVVGAILAFGSGWGWAGLFNMAVVQRNEHAPAVATGFTQAGVYVGAGLGPLVFGVVAEQLSFEVAWWMFAILALGAAVIIRLGDRASANSKRVDPFQIE